MCLLLPPKPSRPPSNIFFCTRSSPTRPEGEEGRSMTYMRGQVRETVDLVTACVITCGSFQGRQHDERRRGHLHAVPPHSFWVFVLTLHFLSSLLDRLLSLPSESRIRTIVRATSEDSSTDNFRRVCELVLHRHVSTWRSKMKFSSKESFWTLEYQNDGCTGRDARHRSAQRSGMRDNQQRYEAQ